MMTIVSPVSGTARTHRLSSTSMWPAVALVCFFLFDLSAFFVPFSDNNLVDIYCRFLVTLLSASKSSALLTTCVGNLEFFSLKLLILVSSLKDSCLIYLSTCAEESYRIWLALNDEAPTSSVSSLQSWFSAVKWFLKLVQVFWS